MDAALLALATGLTTPHTITKQSKVRASTFHTQSIIPNGSPLAG